MLLDSRGQGHLVEDVTGTGMSSESFGRDDKGKHNSGFFFFFLHFIIRHQYLLLAKTSKKPEDTEINTRSALLQ